MDEIINHLLRRIEQKALFAKEQLVEELAEAHPNDKEAIEAGIEYESWFAESCRQSLNENP